MDTGRGASHTGSVWGVKGEEQQGIGRLRRGNMGRNAKCGWRGERKQNTLPCVYLCNCLACSAHVPLNLKCNKKLKKKESTVAHACNPSTLGDWWIMRSGVQDQPGQDGESPSLIKIQKWARCGRHLKSQLLGRLRQKNRSSRRGRGCSEPKLCHCTCLGNRARFCFQKKKWMMKWGDQIVKALCRLWCQEFGLHPKCDRCQWRVWNGRVTWSGLSF